VNPVARWTRTEIIRRILQREAEGMPLSLGGETPVDPALYQAAGRIFGSWRNAVTAAGVSERQARTHMTWTPSRILGAIRALARRRKPPRPNEMKCLHGPLMRAARRIFGSWSAAVTAAGVDAHKLRSCPPWTPERIVEAILVRALRNESLRSRSVHPKSLPAAGIRLFGSWAAALEAAGLDPAQQLHSRTAVERTRRFDARAKTPRRQRPYPTAESVVQAIHKRLQEGAPINSRAVYRDDRALYRAAERLFKCWRNALTAAGLEPRQHQATRERSTGSQERGNETSGAE